MPHAIARPRARPLPPGRTAWRGLAALLPALLLALLAAGALAPGRALAAPPPSVVAQATGNGVAFSVSSSLPVAWEIQLSETRAPTGSPPSFGGIAVQQAGSNGARQPTFAHRFSRQRPGTTHWYLVKATDVAGLSSYATGEVKTLNRAVTLTYSRIKVLDDADDFLRGDGEINFEFAVNNCWQEEWASGYRSLGDGDSYFPNRSLLFQRYHAATLDLAVAGDEEDEDFGDFAPAPVRPPPCDPPVPTTQPAFPIAPEHGSDANGNWATAASRINFFQTFSHAQPTATETWTFVTPAGARLKFQVEVTLSFNYYA